MRSVSFVKHLKLHIDGKVSHQCMVLGDVDGDGLNELLVAMEGGQLEIYRGNVTKPWWDLNDVGDVTCVAIGDVCNQGRNSVIVLTRNGQCSIIDLFVNSDKSLSHTKKEERLIANIIHVLIGDVDDDGKQELITCHSDQSVSAYRWHDKLKTFVLLQRWRLRHLAENVTLHIGSEEGQPSIMVSQPGCCYAVLRVNWQGDGNGMQPTSEASANENIEYTALSSRSRLQNPSISCKIIGDIKKTESKMAGYFAMCTLDGTLKLMEEDINLWSLQVDHQLFALDKMDVLGDNSEEVIVCAWDGQTYIVDHDRNVVRYQFQDNVQAFCAGKYCVDGQINVPCLVYADFHKSISLYYDVKLPFLRATDLLSVANDDADMVELFNKLGLDTAQERSTLLRNCLLHRTAKAVSNLDLTTKNSITDQEKG